MKKLNFGKSIKLCVKLFYFFLTFVKYLQKFWTLNKKKIIFAQKDEKFHTKAMKKLNFGKSIKLCVKLF